MTEAPPHARLDEVVLAVLERSEVPLKARDIVAGLQAFGDPSSSMREVNRLLYGPLEPIVEKDEDNMEALVTAPISTPAVEPG